MKNYCTVCDGRLNIWDRLWGRFDHPTCRSSSTAKDPAPPGPHANSIIPAKTTDPGQGLGIGFRDPAIFPGTEAM